jgi:hypothetical protein
VQVGGRGDILVAGPGQHLRQLGLEGSDGPADGIAIDDRVHPAVHAHAAADAARGCQFGILRPVDIAFLDVEAVEAQQHSAAAADIGCYVDGHTLIDVVLDVAVPQLVPDGEGQGLGGELCRW